MNELVSYFDRIRERTMRVELYPYCSMLDIPAPPIFGLTEEQVHARSMS
jgi:hypothetical protein